MANGFSIATFDRDAIPGASIVKVMFMETSVESKERVARRNGDHTDEDNSCRRRRMSVCWNLPPVVPERDPHTRRVQKTKLPKIMKRNSQDDDKRPGAADEQDRENEATIEESQEVEETREQIEEQNRGERILRQAEIALKRLEKQTRERLDEQAQMERERERLEQTQTERELIEEQAQRERELIEEQAQRERRHIFQQAEVEWGRLEQAQRERELIEQAQRERELLEQAQRERELLEQAQRERELLEQAQRERELLEQAQRERERLEAQAQRAEETSRQRMQAFFEALLLENGQALHEDEAQMQPDRPDAGLPQESNHSESTLTRDSSIVGSSYHSTSSLDDSGLIAENSDASNNTSTFSSHVYLNPQDNGSAGDTTINSVAPPHEVISSSSLTSRASIQQDEDSNGDSTIDATVSSSSGIPRYSNPTDDQGLSRRERNPRPNPQPIAGDNNSLGVPARHDIAQGQDALGRVDATVPNNPSTMNDSVPTIGYVPTQMVDIEDEDENTLRADGTEMYSDGDDDENPLPSGHDEDNAPEGSNEDPPGAGCGPGMCCCLS